MRAASVTKRGQVSPSHHHHNILQLHARVATGVAELLVSEILGPFSLRPAKAIVGLAPLFFADATQLIPALTSQLVERCCRPLGDVEGVQATARRWDSTPSRRWLSGESLIPLTLKVCLSAVSALCPAC